MARISVVDDDHVIRELLVVNLKMEGHEAVTAAEGHEPVTKPFDPIDLMKLVGSLSGERDGP